MRPTSFYSYRFEDLENLCRTEGLVPASARHLFNWHYKKNKRSECEIHNFSKKTKEYFSQLDFSLPEIDSVKESKDKTVKFLFKMYDGLKVETVLIPFTKKYTICLSSQVGCAMKCSFCYTGEQGYKRNLSTEEITGQFLRAQQWLSENRPNDDRILNIVYMGQGEPLHNFDAVKNSAEIFLSQNGVSIAAHKITISTSGYLPGLERWKNEMPDVNIALSLHSPFTEKRNQLIPINKRFPVEDVVRLVDSIPKDEKRFVTYEYLLVKDFNDGAEDAHATGKLLQGKKAYINLIPFNPYPGTKFERPEVSRVEEFKRTLDSYKIPTLIRTTKGDEILAACGQLNTFVKQPFTNSAVIS
jgi:23S rRNA (adenine2503-C2)-methyltransferase